MDYQGFVIRPPNEADSLLIQATLGCTHNKCAFCGAYRAKRFAFKGMDRIMADIKEAGRDMPETRRVFLVDGDVASLPNRKLVPILDAVREHLPRVRRIGAYANARGLKAKTDEELEELREHGLSAAYMGLESGHEEVLAAMNKGVDAQEIVAQGQRLKKAGMKLSATVILGLGGRQGNPAHARATARAINAMAPDQIGALTLMLVPGTELHHRAEAGEFVLPGPMEMLAEAREMLAGIELERGLFLADHASNYLPLKVRLPSGKAEALRALDAALEGKTGLRPEGARRL